MSAHPKHKILVLAANPQTTDRLQLDEEMYAIDHALRSSEHRRDFDLVSQWAVRARDIQDHLLRYQPTIVHFSGHGISSGEIVLQDDHGNQHPVSADALASLFSILKDNIQCVVLNACYSEIQAQTIVQHIPVVIGMTHRIGDVAALHFSESFYRALGYGRNLQIAFELGCNQIDLAKLSEQDIPKLHEHSPGIAEQLVFAGLDNISIPVDSRGTFPEKQREAEAKDIDVVPQNNKKALKANLLPHGQNEKNPSEQYLTWILKNLNKLSLDDIDPYAKHSDAEQYRHIGQIRLTDMYVPATVRKGGPIASTQLDAMSADLEMSHSFLIDCLNDEKKLLLLGDLGSGKSFFVDFVTLCLAGELQGDKQINLSLICSHALLHNAQPKRWDHGALLPVRVSLHELLPFGQIASGNSPDSDLWTLIENSLYQANLSSCAEWLHAHLKNIGGLILLDGLDSLSNINQQAMPIRQMINSFEATFTKCRIVVTSRTYSCKIAEWKQDGFAVVTCECFDEEQVQHLIQRWYRVLSENIAQISFEPNQLVSTIVNEPRIYTLAQNPLLLTLMLSMHTVLVQHLPQKRALFYDKVLRLQLNHWEAQRIRRKVTLDHQKLDLNSARLPIDLLPLLYEIAYYIHLYRQTADDTESISRNELFQLLKQSLQKSITDETDLAYIVNYLINRASLLVKRNNGHYSLTNRTIQEFLTACYLADQDDHPYKIAALLHQSPNHWREVSLLSVGLKPHIPTIWTLVELLWESIDSNQPSVLAWNILLSGQIVEESIERPKRNLALDKLKKLRNHLGTVLEGNDLPAKERAFAGRIIAQLGDNRPCVTTLQGMNFQYVTPGSFYRVVRDNTQNNELLNLSYGYWIGRFPVTQAQYHLFVKEKGYHNRQYWSEAEAQKFWTLSGFRGPGDKNSRNAPLAENSEPFTLPNHPVVGITWYEAMAFCRWLNEKLGNEQWKIRLPTKLEWEKSARGGLEIPVEAKSISLDRIFEEIPKDKKTIENPTPTRSYPWGNDRNTDHCNLSRTKIASTSAVGCFRYGASPYGVEELIGNIWEWSAGLNKNDNALLFGGSWENEAATVSTSLLTYPYYRNNSFGFRCVAVPVDD